MGMDQALMNGSMKEATCIPMQCAPVFVLQACNLVQMLQRYRSHKLMAGAVRCTLKPCCSLDEPSGGRRLKLPFKRLVAEHLDKDAQRDPLLVVGRLSVKLFAEGHDVKASLAKRGAHGRRRLGGARSDEQLNRCHHLPLCRAGLCHGCHRRMFRGCGRYGSGTADVEDVCGCPRECTSPASKFRFAHSSHRYDI